MDIKKICAALCACVVCLCAAGCSKDSKDSSSATESKANVSTADNADSAKSEDSKGDESDADSKVMNAQGELIKKAAAIFGSKSQIGRKHLSESHIGYRHQRIYLC